MERFTIYGCFAEGFVRIGTARLEPQNPISRVYDIVDAYAYLGINPFRMKPVVFNLGEEGFASGFEVGGVTYLHFKADEIPEAILIREA